MRSLLPSHSLAYAVDLVPTKRLFELCWHPISTFVTTDSMYPGRHLLHIKHNTIILPHIHLANKQDIYPQAIHSFLFSFSLLSSLRIPFPDPIIHSIPSFSPRCIHKGISPHRARSSITIVFVSDHEQN